MWRLYSDDISEMPDISISNILFLMIFILILLTWWYSVVISYWWCSVFIRDRRYYWWLFSVIYLKYSLSELQLLLHSFPHIPEDIVVIWPPLFPICSDLGWVFTFLTTWNCLLRLHFWHYLMFVRPFFRVVGGVVYCCGRSFDCCCYALHCSGWLLTVVVILWYPFLTHSFVLTFTLLLFYVVTLLHCCCVTFPTDVVPVFYGVTVYVVTVMHWNVAICCLVILFIDILFGKLTFGGWHSDVCSVLLNLFSVMTICYIGTYFCDRCSRLLLHCSGSDHLGTIWACLFRSGTHFVRAICWLFWNFGVDFGLPVVTDLLWCPTCYSTILIETASWLFSLTGWQQWPRLAVAIVLMAASQPAVAGWQPQPQLA